MKRIITVLLVAITSQSIIAQMDDKFYYPDKEWVEINSLDYKELVLHIDNDTLYSAIFYPEESPKATIIYFHGNAGNISKWVNHITPLVKDGFQVCMLDYRGYGKSTGIPTHLNIAHDAQIYLDTLLTFSEIKETKIIIYGASIGSQVAVNLTKNNNKQISALVLDGMMKSFTDVALLTTPEEYHEMVKIYATSPYSAIEDIKEISGICALFIHSEEDPIPIEGAQEVYETASCPKTFWIYEGSHIEAAIKYPEKFIEYINNLI